MKVRFYNASRKWVWTVEAEVKDGKMTVKEPSRNARFFSTEIDGHVLHRIPAHDPLRVEYE